jgi:L-rhamnose-H+ transport protein
LQIAAAPCLVSNQDRKGGGIYVGIAQGFLLTFLAGAMAGVNLVPLKRIRVWKWENFWLLYSIVSLLIVPTCLAVLLIPHLLRIYMSVPAGTILRPLACGAMWGIAQLGAGICVQRIGLALTGSILNGLCATFGTLTPFVLQHRELVAQKSGMLLLSGTGVMVLGIILCGWSGYEREKRLPSATAATSSRSAYLLVILMAVISGLLAALLNIALAYGVPMIEQARLAGANPNWAVFAVWPVALSGGLLVNLTYSIYLLNRNDSWKYFSAKPAEAFAAILGGVLWMTSIAVYSSATVLLGALGVSVGWALFQITLILSGNVAGFVNKEWEASGRRTLYTNVVGVAVLLVATIVIGAAN